MELDIIVKVFRGVAQVVERYFREVEAASSSLVTPTIITLGNLLSGILFLMKTEQIVFKV